MGIEPTTYGLKVRRFCQLSYTPLVFGVRLASKLFRLAGAPDLFSLVSIVQHVHLLCFSTYLVGAVGFEPTTYGLRVRRCCQLSYTPLCLGSGSPPSFFA